MLFAFQLVILLAFIAAIALWAAYFPYPSPLIQRLLPARIRWPEAQIREWLGSGRFQKSYLAFFYRDPERAPPSNDSVLAPADGLVTSAEVREGVRYLVIALSFWDMHVQRSPLAASVIAVESFGDAHTDGEGRDFAFMREKCCPVQKRLVLETDRGLIAVRLITSLSARRIEVWVDEGEVVNLGQRIGRILLGSTVVLELPADWPLKVSPGTRVWAGETALVKAVSLTSGFRAR